MTELSLYKRFEEATRHYYGADVDMLKFVPAISKEEVAYGIALQVDRQLSTINENDLIASALRAQTRNRLNRGPTDLTVLRGEALDDRLAMIVVNAELRHAHDAPGDFNEDSEQSGAYEMGIGYVIPTKPPRAGDVS